MAYEDYNVKFREGRIHSGFKYIYFTYYGSDEHFLAKHTTWNCGKWMLFNKNDSSEEVYTFEGDLWTVKKKLWRLRGRALTSDNLGGSKATFSSSLFIGSDLVTSVTGHLEKIVDANDRLRACHELIKKLKYVANECHVKIHSKIN